MVVKFKKEETTKRTVRYHEVSDEGKEDKIGVLYLQKWAARSLGRGSFPETLTVEIST